MTHFIYSTHTNPITYVEWEQNGNRNCNVIKRRFLVAGGHGLANKNLVTSMGVVTRVDRDDDMNWLEQLPEFKLDIERGYIRVSKREENAEKIVRKDMQTKDGSSPKTPADYKTNEESGQNHTYSTNAVSMNL